MARLAAAVKLGLQSSGVLGKIAHDARVVQPTWTRLTTMLSASMRTELEDALSVLAPTASSASRNFRAKAIANFFAAFASRVVVTV
jgi:hypothetical protein